MAAGEDPDEAKAQAEDPAAKLKKLAEMRDAGLVTSQEYEDKKKAAEANGINCPTIDGIIEEANDVAGDIADKQVLDAGLIAAAQAAEHYEMARYGTLIAWAKMLGRADCAAVLQKNLDEEKAADRKLTDLAEGKLNVRAAS